MSLPRQNSGCHGHATSEQITIDPVEIEAAMWVSREEMMTIFAGDHLFAGGTYTLKGAQW